MRIALLGAIVAALVAGAVPHDASGGSTARSTYFRVRDLGIVCVRAPCFSYRATVLNKGRRMSISALDLTPAHASPAELMRAQEELSSAGGLIVLGRVTEAPDGGRALHASRIFLRAPKPRA